MNKGTLYGLISAVLFAGFLGMTYMSSDDAATTAPATQVEQAAITSPLTEPAAGEATPLPPDSGENALPVPPDALDDGAAGDEPADDAAAPSAPESSDAQAQAQAPASTPAIEAPVATEPSAAAAADDVPVLPDVILTLALGERSMGDVNAPVSIIEYASMTCSHCAHFHNTILADLKKNYIDTGKVRLTMRDFPLDNMALKAAMMARCAPKENYFNLVEVIFANQQRWLASDDKLGSLKKLGRLAGLTDEAFDSCMENKDLETELLKRMQEGQTQWDIKSTPTFIFNSGQFQFSGAEDYAKFQKTIDPLVTIHNKGQ